jgi:hypothetical protein
MMNNDLCIEGLKRISLLAALLCVSTALASGQENEPPTISTDRPGQSTPPGILPPGCIQIEAGIQFAGDKIGGDGSENTVRTLSLPGALVRIGLLESAELRLSTEYRSVTTTISGFDTTVDGIAGISIGTKVGITQEQGAIPETALLLTLGMPEIGSESFRPAAVTPNVLLSMRNALSRSLNLYYNVGALWDGITPTGTGFYSALLGLTVAYNMGVFAEVYGSLKTGLPPLHTVDAGLSYRVASNIQLDLYGGAGITDNAPDYFANAGISFRLPH